MIIYEYLVSQKAKSMKVHPAHQQRIQKSLEKYTRNLTKRANHDEHLPVTHILLKTILNTNVVMVFEVIKIVERQYLPVF